MLLQITVTSKCITFREKECEHPLTIFRKKIVKICILFWKNWNNTMYFSLTWPGAASLIQLATGEFSLKLNLLEGAVQKGQRIHFYRPFYRKIKLSVSCTFGLQCARQTLITCLIRARSFCLIVPGGWQEATLPQFYFHSPSRSAHEIKFY